MTPPHKYASTPEPTELNNATDVQPIDSPPVMETTHDPADISELNPEENITALGGDEQASLVSNELDANSSALSDDDNDSSQNKEAEPPPLKGRIEAALFITNKPLAITDLAELLNEDMWAVEDALMELMGDMTLRPDSAIELDDTDGYILQVRQEFKPLMETMMPMELSAGAVRVLSAVAIKGPILQSELVETQGSSVYDHIPELLANKLVSKNRVGRSYRLNVTQRFYEYFKLLGDKSELRTMLNLMEGRENRESGHAKRLDANTAHVGEQTVESLR